MNKTNLNQEKKKKKKGGFILLSFILRSALTLKGKCELHQNERRNCARCITVFVHRHEYMNNL